MDSGISIARIVIAPAGGRNTSKMNRYTIMKEIAITAERVNGNPSKTVIVYRQNTPVKAHSVINGMPFLILIHC